MIKFRKINERRNRRKNDNVWVEIRAEGTSIVSFEGLEQRFGEIVRREWEMGHEDVSSFDTKKKITCFESGLGNKWKIVIIIVGQGTFTQFHNCRSEIGETKSK